MCYLPSVFLEVVSRITCSLASSLGLQNHGCVGPMRIGLLFAIHSNQLCSWLAEIDYPAENCFITWIRIIVSTKLYLMIRIHIRSCSGWIDWVPIKTFWKGYWERTDTGIIVYGEKFISEKLSSHGHWAADSFHPVDQNWLSIYMPKNNHDCYYGTPFIKKYWMWHIIIIYHCSFMSIVCAIKDGKGR